MDPSVQKNEQRLAWQLMDFSCQTSNENQIELGIPDIAREIQAWYPLYGNPHRHLQQ